MINKKIIIITGPAGVGKSTTAQFLAKKLKKSAYIDGDVISHMIISGREKPWESDKANKLVLKNIKDLTKNFLDDGCQVVVDWIIFWNDVKCNILDLIEQGIEVRYVILWAEEKVHLERDNKRSKEIQMGKRVLILRDEFKNSSAPSRFFIDNTTMGMEDVIKKIQLDSNFIVLNKDCSVISKL